MSKLRPRTVFFGGGTPTLLPREQMRRLIEGLTERIDLSGVEEWTVEANPATVDANYCEMLRGLAVDRLSFGAQSFREGDLQLLEREHRPGDVAASLAAARAGGFSRLNVDLIYGIPGQTLEAWRESLRHAIDLGTEHLSCYGLTYEPNTPLAVRKRLGQVTAVEESVELEMMALARQMLREVGFVAYEISNYAKPGAECRHNLVYWKGGNYIGLGPSAASHMDGRRWKNRPHLGEWERAVSETFRPSPQPSPGVPGEGARVGRATSPDQGKKERPRSAVLPCADALVEVEELSPQQRAGELAWLMLRLGEGLIYDEYTARVGCDAREVFAEQIDRLGKLGLIELDERGLRLTERGIAVADAVASEFMAR